jgi:endonuclease/exonuclease/phosphatase family metal-dependent hydrolase
MALLLVALTAVVWLITYHPANVEETAVRNSDSAPSLKPGQQVKVITWNVQFMAGKDYVFYFDMLDGRGPDERPSAGAITRTMDEVARVIRDENPDIILLQEVDHGARRTDYEDQLGRLLSVLPAEYGCQASAFYWKAAYVPHPRIRGAVGMKLAVISKYRIRRAVRHQLALPPADPLTRQFSPKRAILEVHLSVENGADFVVLNTHLDAFAQGADTMDQQVGQVQSVLEDLSRNRHPWVVGGDFNLLPPGQAYHLLSPEQQKYFREKTEITPLFDKYPSVPNREEVDGSEHAKWFTHFPNDPRVKGPDRTIDYIFHAPQLRLTDHYVRQNDTLSISDHLPVVARFALPVTGKPAPAEMGDTRP